MAHSRHNGENRDVLKVIFILDGEMKRAGDLVSNKKERGIGGG